MHDPKCQHDELCAECEVYDVGMEASVPSPNEAFHQHLHEVIENAKAASPEMSTTKKPVRIKRADFLVAYYAGGVDLEDTIQCDSLSSAQEIVEEMGADMCRVFIAAHLVLRARDQGIAPEDYERNFTYVGEEIRKEQGQQPAQPRPMPVEPQNIK